MDLWILLVNLAYKQQITRIEESHTLAAESYKKISNFHI